MRTAVARRAGPIRLVAFTDTRELGGADLSLGHLLRRLGPEVEVMVMGVTETIVRRIAAERPDARLALVPPPRSDHDWRSFAAHLSALRSFRPDILHASLASPWSCQYAIAAAGLLRRPRIVAVYQLPVPPLTRRQWLAKRATSWMVDRHVAVGTRSAREVEDLVGLPRGSVVTIHNGVPDVAAQPLPTRWREGPIVGAVGRLSPQKGFDVLLRAMRDVHGASLVLVGAGDLRERLESIARENGIEDRVVLDGWSDDVRACLGAFDVFVLPSRAEGFPLAALEALLAERAVVATDVGSVGEAVIDGETGLLVPPNDAHALATAIRRLLADAELRRRLGASGRRLVLSRFTDEHMASSFRALYDELLARKRPSRR